MESKRLFQRVSGLEPPMMLEGFFEEAFNSPLLKDVVSFDIETFSPNGFPYNAEDPVVNYSLVIPLSGQGFVAISAIGFPKTEGSLLKLLNSLLMAFRGFHLLTHNGVKFDLEYVARRGRLYGLDFHQALNKLQHVDVYQLVRRLKVGLPSYAQKFVEKALGIKRVVEGVSGYNYHRVYRGFVDNGDLTPLFYNLEDGFGCLRIAGAVLRLSGGKR
ncbi:TPA: hypothetical protein EYP27_00300 [Candidatus Bathyarchaeota archaeon]|nr:hypothetical protein [Candidatus Bathyarchaeota archaeon]